MCALLFCFAPTFQFMPNAANSDSPPYGRGIPGSPPRLRRAWGRWDIAALACFAPWRETGLAAAKTGEQSENVYENKGPVQKSTAPIPSLSKEGNSGLPSSDKEGLGVVRLCGLGVLCALA